MSYLNKKAQEGPPGDWMVFIIVLLFAVPIIILLFMSIINSTVAYKTKIPYELEEYILINKFLSSPECFAYYNYLSGDYIPLSVDSGRFNQETIESCYPASANYYALRLTLIDSKDKQIELKTINWDEESGPQKRLQPQFITLYENNEKTNAKIIFELQNAKK